MSSYYANYGQYLGASKCCKVAGPAGPQGPPGPSSIGPIGYTGPTGPSLFTQINNTTIGYTGNIIGGTGIFNNLSLTGTTVELSSSTLTSIPVVMYDTNNQLVYSTSKTFIIDHPLDTEKYLVHVCLEGPEAGVYYRGKDEIVNHLCKTVELPDYVSTLATDFTVQITPIYNEQHDNSHLRVTEVENNQFTVYGNNGKFFWNVYGKRHDVEVEPFKNKVEVKGQGPYKWL